MNKQLAISIPHTQHHLPSSSYNKALMQPSNNSRLTLQSLHLDLHSVHCRIGRLLLTVFTRQMSGQSLFLTSSGGRSVVGKLSRAATYTLTYSSKSLPRLLGSHSTVYHNVVGCQAVGCTNLVLGINNPSACRLRWQCICKATPSHLTVYDTTCESVFAVVRCSVNRKLLRLPCSANN